MKHFHHRLLSIAAIGVITSVAVFYFGQIGVLGADDAASPSIKEIMKIAHTGDKKAGVDPLCKVVNSGKGTHDTAEELLKLYKALAAAKPPKGDDADWKTRTDALVAAAEELVKGDKPSPASIAIYRKALDCKGCHTEHKPAAVKK